MHCVDEPQQITLASIKDQRDVEVLRFTLLVTISWPIVLYSLAGSLKSALSTCWTSHLPSLHQGRHNGSDNACKPGRCQHWPRGPCVQVNSAVMIQICSSWSSRARQWAQQLSGRHLGVTGTGLVRCRANAVVCKAQKADFGKAAAAVVATTLLAGVSARCELQLQPKCTARPQGAHAASRCIEFRYMRYANNSCNSMRVDRVPSRPSRC